MLSKIKNIWKEVLLMMAMFFAQRVILGKSTFESVPTVFKKEVAETLIYSGLATFVPQSFGDEAD